MLFQNWLKFSYSKRPILPQSQCNIIKLSSIEEESEKKMVMHIKDTYDLRKKWDDFRFNILMNSRQCAVQVNIFSHICIHDTHYSWDMEVKATRIIYKMTINNHVAQFCIFCCWVEGENWCAGDVELIFIFVSMFIERINKINYLTI